MLRRVLVHMPSIEQLRAALSRALQAFRLGLSRADALPQLSFLGLLCGVLTGVVMVAFRFLIESVQAAFLPGGDPEAYEALSREARLLLPLAGGLAIGLLFQWMAETDRRVGVVHVLERLAYHQARLPLRNAVVQFVGAALSIIAGHSVGREGPAIHLGAATTSLPGQALGLPNNSLRVLVACGVAAAIAASFNTPLAGVVFAMEVVMMEYTVLGFAPVILAAVSATAVSHLVYGDAPAFSVPQLHLGSLWELPYVLAVGAAIGALAAGFIALLTQCAARTAGYPYWVRTTLAGGVVGLCALAAPEIMSIGYDTANDALLGQAAIPVLLLLILFKLPATAASVGLGLPGGLIGPSLVIGAAAGGVLGAFGQWVAPEHASSVGFYALIGMGAMMAGVLHAPLAALTAMLELTANPNVIWPDMLAVIAAYGISRVVFRQPSAFLALMRARGLDYHSDPISQSLRRVGVGAALDRSVAALSRRVTREVASSVLASNPRWLLACDAGQPVALLPAVDLARYSLEHPAMAEFDLLELPAARVQVAQVPLQATLYEGLVAMDSDGAEALCVELYSVPGTPPVYGVVTRREVERNYRYT